MSAAPPSNNGNTNLVVATYQEYENAVDAQAVQCPGCREEFKEEDFENDGVLRDKYNHFMHKNEYIQWLRYKKECPECRRTINETSLQKLKIIIPDNIEIDDEDDNSNLIYLFTITLTRVIFS